MTEEALLEQIRNLIATQIGLSVREQDNALLRKVVAERVRALNLSGAEQYCQYLGLDANIRYERKELTIPLTTGETYFFRDSGQFALLKNRILPELLERRKAEHSLRIWCAACSSGEEAYSLAILLDELMADQSKWNIFILGTDISLSAIEKARQGIYTEWSFRGMSDERRRCYFRRNKNAWVLNDAIRRRVTFHTGDLVADDFPSYASDLYGMDLILCRNTFIYMTPQVVFRTADKLTETLIEGGILISGHGELYAYRLGKLRVRVFPESIVYQKVAAPLFMPASPTLIEERPTVPARPAVAVPAIQKTKTDTTLQPQPAVEASKETAALEMQQAWQHANQGQWACASKLCRALIAKNPLVAEPHYLLALLAQEHGDFAEAKDLLKKVIYLDASFIAAYLDLGDLYALEGGGGRAGKMRAAARDLLKLLPGDDQVKFYGASTVKAMLQYVEHLLSIEYDSQ